MKSLILLLSMLLMTSISSAGELQDGTMMREDVEATHLSLLGLMPERSTVAEVRALLGPAKLMSSGSSERTIVSFCYVSSDPDRTKVVFEAVDSLPGTVINRISLYSGDVRYRGAGSCYASLLVDAELATGSGLRLNQTEARFKERLGTPTEEWSGYIGYEYHVLKELSASEIERVEGRWPYVLKYPYVDIHSSIEGRFYKNSLKRLDLRRIVAKP